MNRHFDGELQQLHCEARTLPVRPVPIIPIGTLVARNSKERRAGLPSDYLDVSDEH